MVARPVLQYSRALGYRLTPRQAQRATTEGGFLWRSARRTWPEVRSAADRGGTGKTDTLAHRVAHLTINGVDPGRILMLTFTRRAAAEMRRRAHDIIRKALNESIGGLSQTLQQRLVWTGTFHSIGNRLLRHYAPHLKLDPQFTVIDRADSADLLDGLRQELALAAKEQRFPRKETCLQIYSYRVNTGRELPVALEEQYPWCAQWQAELTKLFRAYVERKQRCNLLDYDDLLLYWHAMMGEARLAAHVSGNFDHVLVDEYQDTNKLQADILHALRPDGAGLAVVGDDAQAIYSFRAAAVENILGFPERFTPRAEVITLAQNYRSTQPVLDAANALMSEAPRQHRKHLLAVRGTGVRPRLVTIADLGAQAEYVCNEVLRRREANVPLHRHAAAHPVRKIRRAQISRSRAHQRSALGAALGGQSAQHRCGLSGAAAPARHGPGQCAPRARSLRRGRRHLCIAAGVHAARGREV